MNSTKDENMEKQEEKVTKQEEVNNHEEQSETPARLLKNPRNFLRKRSCNKAWTKLKNASQRFRTNTSVCQLNLTITASAP